MSIARIKKITTRTIRNSGALPITILLLIPLQHYGSGTVLVWFAVPVLWILIGFNADPDPAFWVYADPALNPDRIYGFLVAKK
jgi:hypothetical protein